MEENDKNHHFLYYIFQYDKKNCKMDAEQENGLKRQIRKMLQLFHKGERENGKSETD